ncbi:patatin-like protein [Kribbella sp. NPDC026611]|uniref:patatin-like protein n=1 Tax=Kribbella sp. NPDC026611 TaxID=3154911 RepID=UPI003403C2D9
MAQQYPKEQIRFAVVLNGGVSLAVWMGGVVQEINALTRGDGVYGELLDLLDLEARADVIAGTSAGGINGAALALGQANKLADVSLLRDLWAEQGRMDNLLQQPFRGAPASLLRGDDYFLPKLQDAFKHLVMPWDPETPEYRPVDLTITTTLLNGARTVSVDSLGQQLPQRQHEGQFRFRRGAPSEDGEDDFAPHKDPDLVAARIAIAARCSAGFPLAFEPCFVPAVASRNQNLETAEWKVSRSQLDVTRPTLRPDLGRYVSWRDAGPADEVPDDRSRYAVDGGVLENTPTQRALEAISRMPAGGLVHRVILMVYPHAPTNDIDPPDAPGTPPDVTETLGGLLGALMSQSSRTFVDEVENFNRASASRRGTRHDVLETAAGPDKLETLADTIFASYRQLRIRRAARDLAQRFTPPTNWSYERIRQAAEDAQRTWLETGPLPYVPPEIPARPPVMWTWGVTAGVDIAESAIDLLDRLIGVAHDEQIKTCADSRSLTCAAQERLRQVRCGTDDIWTADGVLRRLRPSAEYWSLRLAFYAHTMVGMPDGVLTAAADELKVAELAADDGVLSPAELDSVAGTLLAASSRGALGVEARQAVGDVVKAVYDVLDQLRLLGEDSVAIAGLEPWQALFAGSTGLDDVFQRLLWLHVATWTIADESPTEATLPIDLVQVSLRTPNDFAKYSTTPDDKVGGLSLRRFGGFLKRSWRMNDWTWGRIDAATMLCQILLSPQRIQRHIVLHDNLQDDKRAALTAATAFVTRLGESLFNSEPELLAPLRQQAADELVPLYLRSATSSQLPTSLPRLAALAAWALHLGIATKELPAIAAAVKADRADRANRYSRGELFIDQYDDLLADLRTVQTDQPLTLRRIDLGRQALEALDRAGIGREPITDEARSDQLIRTATTAASVAVTVADSSRSGLSAIKPVTRTLRGGMLFPYWTVLGLASSGPIARFLALWLLGSGAVLLALPLLGVLHGWAAAPATAIGVGALLTAFGFAALRTGTLLHGIVLLTPLIPLIALAAQRWNDRPAEDGQVVALGTLGTILALALTLTLLGSLPANLGTPLAGLYNALDRTAQRYNSTIRPNLIPQSPQWRRRLETLITWFSFTALKIVALILAVVAIFVGAGWADVQARSWKSHHVLLVLIVIGLALIAWVLGFIAGWSYRLWSESAGAWRTRPVNLPNATAATWSVIYGTIFLVIAAWVIWHWPQPSNWAWRAALITSVVFALSLLYVVPGVVLLHSRLVLPRRLAAEAKAGVITWPQPVQASPAAERDEQQMKAVIEVLHRRQLSYRCLLRAERPERTAGTDTWLSWTLCYVVGWKRPAVDQLVLTGRGRKLADRVTRVTAETRG